MGILIREMFVNQDKGYIIGESEVYETFADTRGKLFRSMQKEYGRCVSGMYIGRPNGKSKKIGWVFEKKVQYEDTGRYGRPAEYYTQETWVEIHKKMPKTTIKNYY